MRKINVGLIGFGNVGSGVVKILCDKKAFLSDKIGLEINIKKICDLDIISKRNVNIDKSILSKNVKDINSMTKDAIFTYFKIPAHLCNDSLVKANNEPKFINLKIFKKMMEWNFEEEKIWDALN